MRPLIIFFLLFPFQTRGQNHSLQGADLALHAVIIVLDAISKAPRSPEQIPASEIHGQCYFQASSCAGAILTLKDSRGKVIDSLALTASSSFKFFGLKTGEYEIEVSFPRKLSTKRSYFTPAGREIVISFDLLP